METKESSYISKPNTKTEEELECAVCLQPCIHPVRLPCSHIFCFLCVKGIANQSKRCAMCRQEIPADFLDNPDLLKKIEEKELNTEGYHWFYEGRNGWWQYDERTSIDLESAFSRGQRVFEVLVAGFLYSVDFDKMVQQRRNDPSRRRRIKRDLSSIPKKGVAGLKTDFDTFPQQECPTTASDLNVQLPPEVGDSDNPPTQSGVITPTAPVDDSAPIFPLSSPSLELENLHLLHSDLHRRLLGDLPGIPSAVRANHLAVGSSLRNIEPCPRVTRESPSQYSTYSRLQHLFNDNTSCQLATGSSTSSVPFDDKDNTVTPASCSNRNPESSESVDAIANHVQNLALDENEYYSLDGTEEYDLPNDNEDL